MTALALICGTGALPAEVASAHPPAPFVCALDGFLPTGLTPDLTFRIETLGTLLGDLNDRGIASICLCGSIRRPPVDPMAIDAATMPFVPRIVAAMQRGDDGALREVMTIFEEAGFAMKAAHALAPDLLPQSGVLTSAQPGPDVEDALHLAEAALIDMSQNDLGQACVVQDGQVIAREDDGGTDEMLSRLGDPDARSDAEDPINWTLDAVGHMLGDAADWLSGLEERPVTSRNGFLFKAPKTTQDRRADLPTIGPTTARAAAHAGLAGIVIEAGGVIVLDLQAVLDVLNSQDMFLWVRQP